MIPDLQHEPRGLVLTILLTDMVGSTRLKQEVGDVEVDEPVEVCEIGESGVSPLAPPASTANAQRFISPASEPFLGWRPAVGQKVPRTQWVLVELVGTGGVGEVWLAEDESLKTQRIFKFCFRADKVRSLKREVTLFRVLKEQVGEHPHIVRLFDVYFDEPPY